MRLIVERRVAIKELWEVSDPWDPYTPLHLQGQRRSHEYAHLAPVTVRPHREGEDLHPNLDAPKKANAERGYWRRLMRAFKESL